MTPRCSADLLLLACFAGLGLPSITTAAEPPVEVKQAIAELASDTFLVREKASDRLFAAGELAIPGLEAAGGQGELETTIRALQVLESLAVAAKTDATRDAALAAVQRLAETRVGRAEVVLAAITQARRAQAIAHLESLGAIIHDQPIFVGAGFLPAEFSIEIGPGWRGQNEDLKQLTKINDLRVLSLQGEQVDDAWLTHVAAVSTLQSIKLKKVKVTAAGLEQLRALKELFALDLLYFPLDDAAAGPLTQMPQLSSIRLFDTQVTKAAAAKLAADLPNTKIDVRRGGFLGIGVERHPLGCFVTRVEPKSVAALAGVSPGDIILSIAGERPVDFQNLTAIIAKYRPGEEVTLELYRDDEREMLKLKLGEWE